MVEVERRRFLLGEQLDGEIPRRILAVGDRGVEVAAVIVGIGAVDLDRLVPHHRLHAEHRQPVELDEGRLALGVDQPEGVDAEALHHPHRPRDRPVGHLPHDHVHRLGRAGDEVPEGVVRRLRLREAAVGLLLDRVDQVGKLDRVLDEEHRDVVADEVPVALGGVHLDREAADVARDVGRAAVAGDGREAGEHRRRDADLGQDPGGGEVLEAVGQLEMAVRGEAAGVDDALGNALVVEVEDLLAQDEVLEQRRAARAGLEAVDDRRRSACRGWWSAPAGRQPRPGGLRRRRRGRMSPRAARPRPDGPGRASSCRPSPGPWSWSPSSVLRCRGRRANAPRPVRTRAAPENLVVLSAA